MDPNFGVVHGYLQRVYSQTGNLPQALAESEKARQLSDDPADLGELGYIYAASGKRDEARKRLAELQELAKSRYVAPYSIAIIYIGLNERDQALAWLEKAYQVKDAWLAYLKVDPIADSLRSDPRFTDLLRRVGFEP